MAVPLQEFLDALREEDLPGDALIYVDDGGLTVWCDVEGEKVFGYEIGGEREEEPDTPKPPEVMVKINGETFRCECGCNVFHKPMYKERPELYECNGCGDLYEGSKFDERPPA